MSKKKVGIFGGSFDPIHYGHISIALDICEKKQLDEIWFLPAFKNPLKTNDTLVEGNKRVEMIQLAISQIPQFKLCDLEVYSSRPSYTVDTLRQLVSTDSNLSTPQFFLIIGTDSLVSFSEWKEPAEILKLATLAVGTRTVQQTDQINDILKKWHIGSNALIATKILEISSTDIRNRLKNGLYCGHLLPAKVIDYIYDHHLYSTT